LVVERGGCWRGEGVGRRVPSVDFFGRVCERGTFTSHRFHFCDLCPPWLVVLFFSGDELPSSSRPARLAEVLHCGFTRGRQPGAQPSEGRNGELAALHGRFCVPAQRDRRFGIFESRWRLARAIGRFPLSSETVELLRFEPHGGRATTKNGPKDRQKDAGQPALMPAPKGW
jgi:hypothetical protein